MERGSCFATNDLTFYLPTQTTDLKLLIMSGEEIMSRHRR